MDNGFGPRDLAPMLEKLLKIAPPDSHAHGFAALHLARLLVRQSPWRAATLARSALRQEETDAAWGTLGVAYLLLGHHRAARRALGRARTLAPGCAAHAHNLGHLLDAGLGRPREALAHLLAAHAAAPEEPEITSSLAHALLRSGQRSRALHVLQRRMGLSRHQGEALLERWRTPSRHDSS